MEHDSFWALGISAPIFFSLAVWVLGSIKPDYSHVYHTMSELGEAGSITAQPAALVFIVTGIMITLFGYGLQRRLRRDDKRVWAGVLMMLYGLLDFVGSGVFPVDTDVTTMSLVSSIHVYATLVGEFSALGMPIWFLKDTEGVEGRDALRRFSRLSFWISLPLIGFLGYCILGHTPGQMDTPIGLAQRLLVAVFLAWIMATAYWVREKER